MDIETILSKRAKNPWLDTAYALLSYLLTRKLTQLRSINIHSSLFFFLVFALVVWIIIYVLKWGKLVVLFPKMLFQTYQDYVVERNKAVKKASVDSVSVGMHTTLLEERTLFQRTNRVLQRDP